MKRQRRTSSKTLSICILSALGLSSNFSEAFVLPSQQKQKPIRPTLVAPSSSKISSTLFTSSMEDICCDSSLRPWERWCVRRMERWYRKALSIKCPFFRRRASDILDTIDQVLRFVIIRHKSLDVIGPPAGWRCEGDTCDKVLNLEVNELVDILRDDWRPSTCKGYYITGKLNTTVYRDDCFFDGPDPDMPVQGLRKYLNAASQLFDPRTSRAELLSIEAIDESTIEAQWKMNGVLRLPWHPKLPTWTGCTTYHRDGVGLIYKHTETWDMSVFQAFLRTFMPGVAETVYATPLQETSKA